MASILKPKKSTTASVVPTTASLADGEMAFNTADKKIYVRVGAAIVDMLPRSGATTLAGYGITDAVGTTGDQSIAGNKTFTGALADSAGHVRDLAINTQNAAYTLALADRGKCVLKNNTTAYTWTIPPNSSVAFPVGTMITLRNANATGAVTIARGSGVALRKAGSGTDANATLGVWGMATLLKEGTDSWVISGTGGELMTMQQMLACAVETGAPFTPVLRDYTSGSSVTETAPSGCSQVRICVWSGGSGGDAGDGAVGGDGGDSGSYCESVYSISGGQTLMYTVGAGGTGGAYPAGAGNAGGTSTVTSGTATITTMSATAAPSGGNVTNTYPNVGGLAVGPGGGAGGTAIVGWSGYSAGAGGAGGARFTAGQSGAAGRVIFYYT
ncbi:hypothetical protein LJB71_08335 [Thermomonas sp. S9]|uniref:glycine-rich domain-containing protein n=1 Tax=Thermomonas sp. S9 TaxID=2885203 RepID=UPI00216AB5DF|nr:hypothetical protein [Thermomonas sp. S9]MCR6496223.1 hypothetical protein [Thermomonas sp. S9]